MFKWEDGRRFGSVYGTDKICQNIKSLDKFTLCFPHKEMEEKRKKNEERKLFQNFRKTYSGSVVYICEC